MYICKICQKQIKSGCALAKHVHSKHDLLSQQYYDMYYKKENEGICPTCGKNTPFLKFTKGYQKHCCARCAQVDINVNNTFRNNNPQKNPVIKEKIQQTCQTKYGGNSALCNKTVREKGKQTLKNKYNVENMYQLPSIQIKAKNNSHTKEANDKRNSSILDNIHQLANEIDAIYIQDVYKMTKSSGWSQCGLFEFIKYKDHLFIKKEDISKILEYDTTYHNCSIKEKEIVNMIHTIYNKDIQENKRKIIPPKEIDIYLPDLKLAIEYNGLYFHSTLAGTNKNYHLEKSLLCREKNIRLIHIYEFENFNEQLNLLKDLILGIDNYPKDDFNKNNLIKNIPQPEIIYNDGRLIVYGAGKLK